MMISESKNPVISKTKHMVDLNESAFQSRPRLMAFFRHVAVNEAGLKKREINSAIEKFSRSRSIDTMVRAMDRKIGKYVIFYWGVGDVENDPIIVPVPKTSETAKEAKKNKTKRTRKKKDSMTSLEDNMKDSTVAGSK